jgi:hypothetical protein
MSTDGPQPTQGAPKKKKKVGRLFFGIVFLSLVFFLFFFGGPLDYALSLSVVVCGQGALGPQKKTTDLDVVGWFLGHVGGQKSTKAGQIFPRDFVSCFLNPLTEKRPKT